MKKRNVLKTITLALCITASTQTECVLFPTSFNALYSLIWKYLENSARFINPFNIIKLYSFFTTKPYKLTPTYKHTHVGFINSGVNCFFNATLTLFLHNPAIREKLLSHKKDNNNTKFIESLISLADSIESPQNDCALDPTNALDQYYKSHQEIENLLNNEGGDANETALNFINNLNSIMPHTFSNNALCFKTCQNCKKTSPSGTRPGNAFSTNLKKSLKGALKDDGYTATATGKVGVDLDESSNKKRITVNLQENYSGHSKDVTDGAHCTKCNKKDINLAQTYKFTQLPEHLLIMINRTSYNKTTYQPVKNMDPIKIPFALDMTPYCITSLAKKSPHYDLAGFIVQIGKSAQGGHYICYMKKNKNWFKFNDAKSVKEIDLPKIQKMLSGSAYKGNATPVVFMYNQIQK
ncbi:TPA: hypothetical protein DDZ86_00495 [Candidatus Dependentiae bacterium]|nr:MAG: Ubiquitin carboxyl-terminal hydrolase [candidate division TM6 bacterium GW2011_GWF2_43_87]HBL98107.1 hypothetical protein [Candidatus Dependentiae bacterium]